MKVHFRKFKVQGKGRTVLLTLKQMYSSSLCCEKEKEKKNCLARHKHRNCVFTTFQNHLGEHYRLAGSVATSTVFTHKAVMLKEAWNTQALYLVEYFGANL